MDVECRERERESKCQLILVLTNLAVEIGNWSGWLVSVLVICVPGKLLGPGRRMAGSCANVGRK